NDFVGVPTGIMDQSAALLCQAGHALLLDCRSGEADSVPLDPARSGLTLVIIDTRARHALTESGYGARHIECEEAARALGVRTLREVAGLESLSALTDPVLRRRARHVVTENQRVLETAALLRQGQVDGIGRLLNESHASLRDDFEISWPEADVAVDAAAGGGELAELRRQIHQDPEIGLELPRTQAKVLAALDGLPLEVSQGRALSSVTAVLRGGQPGATVLLRGDMDALPITERTGLPYASLVTGVMHACGHDLHTAMLVGAARILSARQAGLAGNVIFMFQPGEEGRGGAAHMITEGVLDAAGGRPVAAYALHAASAQFPPGMFA